MDGWSAGQGCAPSEPHYIAGPQWIVTGFRREVGAEGEGERFTMNGAAPDNDAAAERAHRALLERGYEHVLVTAVRAVDDSKGEQP